MILQSYLSYKDIIILNLSGGELQANFTESLLLRSQFNLLTVSHVQKCKIVK